MDFEGVNKELSFRTSRSGGKGGQNVNKVETKVELLFDLLNSEFIREAEKNRVLEKLKNRITSEGILILQCSEARTQLQNKKIVLQRFNDLMKEALFIPKKRKPTKPSKGAIAKRLKDKKLQSEKKKRRNEEGF